MSITMIERLDLAAHRPWSNHRMPPAYLRGLPTWWMAAALTRPVRRQPATAVT